MPDESRIEVCCISCGKWFQSGVDALDDEPVKDTEHGNLQECPHCGAIAQVSKENMRVV